MYKSKFYAPLALLSLVAVSPPATAEVPVESPLCRPFSELVPPRPLLDATGLAEVLQLSAAQAMLQEDNNTALFQGEVLLRRGDQIMRADNVLHNRNTGDTDALGGVTLWDQAFVAQAESARLRDGERGSASKARYWLWLRRGRGEAERIEKIDQDRVVLRDASYTTCDPGSEAWKLQAGETELDFDADTGTSRDVVLRVQGLPVFYTPYLTYPISDKPKSGFLAPRVGNSNSSGMEFSVPYYWRIAPNYDATLTPRLMSKRGLGLDTEFRYLTARSDGQINWEYWAQDEVYGSARSFFRFSHLTRFNPRLQAALLYQEVSDNDYFDDLSTSLGLHSTEQLERSALLRYQGRGYQVVARAQNFQTLSDNPALEPYARLPQIMLHSGGRDINRQFNHGVRAEWVYFHRDQASAAEPTGWRANLKTSLNYPWRTPYSFVVPGGFVQYTAYHLDHGDESTADNRPDRLLGGIYNDAGLFFERPLRLADTDLLQTLEPRLYYQYSPYKNQDALPVFDTARYDLSWAQMFRDERFSGPDRVGDEHSLTLALSSRLLGAVNGREYLRAGLAQIYYFRDRRVGLPNQPAETDNSSDVVAELAAQTDHGWSAAYTAQWQAQQNNTVYNAARLRYQPEAAKVLNLAYRYREDLLEQTDLSWFWPLNPRWRSLGRWNYSLAYNRTLETFFGLEYQSCCWALRAVARRYLQTPEGDYHTGFYLQLELKGLAGLGRNTSDFLHERIPGFEDEF